MKMSLKTKIIVPVIVVLVLLVLTIFYFVTIHTASLANTLSNERMIGAAQTARIHLEGLEEQSQLISYAVAINPQFIEYVRSQNREDMLDYLSTHKSVFGVDAFVVTDRNGYVILRTHDPDRYGDGKHVQKQVSFQHEP